MRGGGGGGRGSENENTHSRFKALNIPCFLLFPVLSLHNANGPGQTDVHVPSGGRGYNMPRGVVELYTPSNTRWPEGFHSNLK